MSLQQIPIDNAPNQSWNVTVNVNNTPVKLSVTLRFNEIAGYWIMSIKDILGNLLLDSIPLVTGTNPTIGAVQNLLGQFGYLAIGSVAIVNLSGVDVDHPGNLDLGTDFGLFWGDNPA